VKGSSLRLRLIIGGMAAILLALTIAGGGLVHLFKRHVARTIADDLNLHLSQILAALDVNPDGTLVLTRKPGDPRFEVPLSGLYWQVSDDHDQLLRSRSLWDATLPIAMDALSPGEEHRHVLPGPGRDKVLAAERSVVLTVGDRKMPVRVAVAASLAGVSKAAEAFTRDLAIALAILGAVLTGATILQVSLGLRPLDRLRRGVADIRAGRIVHLPTAVPPEVKPLVEEMNALVESQEREIERSRGRAADLAHGLKTPLAALTADARRLRERGESAIADDIETVVAAMGRHVDRQLARARARGVAGRSASRPTDLAPLVGSLISTLTRTPDGARVVFDARIPPDFAVPMDRTDLAEVLGNLLENAARHAATRVAISAGPGVSITVEDDGLGIAPEVRRAVIERGVRLDERKGGAGLGLAIVQDVLDAYGWRLRLDGSASLGGVMATIAPDAQGAEAV